MTADKALYAFFNGFLPAYPDTAVPEKAVFPYMTYQYVVGHSEDAPISMTANIWCNTESEVIPNAYAETLAQRIGPGGVMLECDEGMIWIKRGEPWCTALNDEGMPSIKRRMLNLEIEYLTR